MPDLYLAQLTLNPQCRDVQRDLSDPYDMHRTLCRAASLSPDHLLSFLWRREPDGPAGAPVVLVQAEDRLNWSALPADYLAGLATKAWQPEQLQSGRRVRFRVVANPTVFRAPDDHQGPARGHRKRFGLRTESEQLEWIERKAAAIGLRDVSAAVTAAGTIRTHRKRGQQTVTVHAVQFDGTAVIHDPTALADGVRHGIGRARMLGLGLVSLAPC